MSDPLAGLAKRAGILPDYVDVTGEHHVTSAETQIALLAAMGFDAATPGAARRCRDELQASGDAPRWQVLTAGSAVTPTLDETAPWQLCLEDGGCLEGRGSADFPVLPIGRHLLTQDGARTWLLAAPGRLPDPPRAWGVTAPLAGLRTARQGGVGDYTDLARAALATAQAGAAFFGINPVHAGFPSDPKAFSPYTPSHRQWLNTLHIATDAAPASRGALIDYAAETRRQFAALRADYAAFQDAGAFDAFETYRAAMGDALQRFATHQALSGEHGPYWNDWPKGLRRADAPDVAQATVALADDIRFHAWAQWRAETQLARVADDLNAAGMRFGLYLDLAVGTHPHGAETWENPGLFAQGAALGAPPDAFAPDGQNWNLAPMVPHVLADEGFATLAAILRRQFQFARLLRIDHILGFERAFWATGDAGVPGAYVKMPLDAMLAVTRIEAARAGATVIGEDLGNIPAGLQSALKSSGLLGCRVVAFEQDVAGGNGFRPATQYDPQTLASFSTHDLPTWRGWRKGADIAAHSRLGHIDTPQRARALATRKAETAAFDALTDTRGMHGFLADCGSGLVAVQIENVLDVEDQPNLPGTIDEYPNWRQRLPVAIADYLSDDRLMHIASIMNSQERRNRP